jgi:branched-chain amino acid transport system permease protein
MILVMLWVIIGNGWKLLAGYTGQSSFGAADFFGIRAYVAGLRNYHLGWSA